MAGVVHLARTRYQGTNHTHLSELLSEREGIDIGRTTRRRILVSAGLSSPRRRRPPKHRVRRQRMPRESMLIQMDGSPPVVGGPDTAVHAADRRGRCHGQSGRRPLLRPGGRPQLLPAGPGSRAAPRRAHRPLHRDRHGVFKHTPGPGLAGTSTQFSRAMEELGIQMIFALSPQAKGRVERAAGTFQDRLVTELRLAGVSSIGEANSVLEQFLPRFNRRRGSSATPRACIPASGPSAVPGTGHVLQAPQDGGQGQYGEIPAPHPPVVARAGTQQLCRSSGGGTGRTGRPAFGTA